GRRGGAGLAGDVDDLHVAVRRRGQHLPGAVEEALPGGQAPPTGDAAVRRARLVVARRTGHGPQGGGFGHAVRLPVDLTPRQEPVSRSRSSYLRTLFDA